jgi:hypothetical protein
MTEVKEKAGATARFTKSERIAGLPLWLHVRAHSSITLILGGAIAGAILVVGGWRSMSSATEFFSVWACTGAAIYGVSYAWYAIRRRLGAPDGK